MRTGRAVRGADAGGASRGPRPQKVVAADRPERVEHLAAEEQSLVPAALHRPRVDLGEVDAAAGDFRLSCTLRRRSTAAGRARACRSAAAARRGRAARADVPARRRPRADERFGESVGQCGADRGEHRARSRADAARPPSRCRRSGVHCTVIARGLRPSRERAHGDVRHVEHRRSAVALMREQKSAGRLRLARVRSAP